MAVNTKKAGTKRKSNTRIYAQKSKTRTGVKRANKRTTAKKKKFIASEASFVLLIAVGIIMLLICFGVMGSLGEAVNGLLMGLFGQGNFLFGLLLLAVAFESMYERGDALKNQKLISIAVIFILLLSFLELLFGGGSRSSMSLSELYNASYLGGSGGGAIGGVIAGGLSRIIGHIGAWIVFIAIFIVSLVVLTEKSILSILGLGVKESAKALVNGAQKTVGVAKNAREVKRQRKVQSITLDYSDANNTLDHPASNDFSDNIADLKVSNNAGVYPVFNDTLDHFAFNNAEDYPKSQAPTSQQTSGDLSTFDPSSVDYDVDTVPFDETPREKYKSYYMVGNDTKVPGIINLDTGNRFGYAVGNKDDVYLGLGKDFKPASTYAFTDKSPNSLAPGGFGSEACDEDKATDLDHQKIPSFDDGGSGGQSPDISYDLDGDVIPFPDRKMPSTALDFEEEENSLRQEPNGDLAELSSAKEAPLKTQSQPITLLKSQPEPVTPSRSQPEPVKPYVFPTLELLKKGNMQAAGPRNRLDENAVKLEKVLRDFGVGVTVTNVTRGPRVSRYEMIPDTGVKVSRITSLEGDIKLALAATELRIEAPIPGKSAVGIEIPNSSNQLVRFRDILESEEFKKAGSRLSWGIGLDIQGRPVVADISRMPHVLVAGTTGSGKSVGINSLIMSILYKATPDEVKMILVDPKVVELSVYNGIPHLLTDVVTKPEKALSALSWAVAEMNRRYRLFEQSGTRNITGYNEKVERTLSLLPEDTPKEDKPSKLPLILIIIDELSELMMHAKKDVEASIVSLTQLARAAGIHLVVATQRPSVDVITGLIKSNIPSRIAYRLPSAVDSRTILDSSGAETLLGNGDMLYKPGDKNSPQRVQGAFLQDEEVEAVVRYICQNNSDLEDRYDIKGGINAQMKIDLSDASAGDQNKPDRDDYFFEAGRLIINSKKASIGALQRKFKVGFNRAARIMDQLHEAGVVSDSDGTKERQILMTLEEFEALK